MKPIIDKQKMITMHISRNQILLTLCFVFIVLINGCVSTGPGTIPGQTGSETTSPANVYSETTWITIPITDAVTGNQTSIAELASQGKPIVMHTFAVWCPACSLQLRETKNLIQNNPDKFIILGVDIDPRENTALLKNHIEKNKFSGIYIIAPQGVTRGLIETFGNKIMLSLPQTVIISNQSVTYIGDGVFPEEKLETILSQLPS